MSEQGAPRKPVFEEVDEWLDRLQIVDEGDEAVAAFLGTLDLRGPREREMLAELARRTTLADPDGFPAAHRRAVAALESLGRHGYHSAVVPGWLRPKFVGRFLLELIARYVIVSFLRRVSTDMRNLYWLRTIESAPGTPERAMLHKARMDADGLMAVFKRREIGLPSFVIGGLLLPVVFTTMRLARGVAVESWWGPALVGLVGGLVVLATAWISLRGAAMASRRIRLATRTPLAALWTTVGNCRNPPRDQSRKFAIVAIIVTAGAWIVFPAAVAIAVWT